MNAMVLVMSYATSIFTVKVCHKYATRTQVKGKYAIMYNEATSAILNADFLRLIRSGVFCWAWIAFCPCIWR